MPKLDKHKLKEKLYLKAERELNKIREKIRESPSLLLDKPYQMGWNVILCLRDDFANSPKGPIVQGILDKHSYNSYTRSAKHVASIRKKPTLTNALTVLSKGMRYKRNCVGVKNLTQKSYNLLSEAEKKWFSYEPKSKYDEYYWFNLPSHYLVVKITKRMITHIKDVDPLLQQRKAELEAILQPYWLKFGNNRESWENYFENRSERRKIKIELTKI